MMFALADMTEETTEKIPPDKAIEAMSNLLALDVELRTAELLLSLSKFYSKPHLLFVVRLC